MNSMRVRLNVVWVLTAAMVLLLLFLTHLSIGDLQTVDRSSISDRAEMHQRLDSLEARVQVLETGRQP